jgi:hypothetical protein
MKLAWGDQEGTVRLEGHSQLQWRAARANEPAQNARSARLGRFAYGIGPKVKRRTKSRAVLAQKG